MSQQKETKPREYTPTPWDYEGAEDCCRIVSYVDPEQEEIGVRLNEADAEFIVRAVNEREALLASHAALLEAAESAYDIFPHLIKFLKFQRPGKEFWPNREAGEAAIAKLEVAIAQGEKVRP